MSKISLMNDASKHFAYDKEIKVIFQGILFMKYNRLVINRWLFFYNYLHLW